MPSLSRYIPLPRRIFRYLVLLTALANSLGNVFILLFYRPVFDLLNVPRPQEFYLFVFVTGFSFTMGLLAFLVYLNPEESTGLLIVGIAGKGIYAFLTFYFFVFEEIHWFYLGPGIWDALYTLIFFLFLIQLLAPDLTRLNGQSTFEGLDRPPTDKALLLFFSLTGTGRSGMERVRAGLERGGYQVDARQIDPVEAFFRFPMSFLDFSRIALRALLRRPAAIAPLDIPADHPYDLIVVESQTWSLGMSAPVEAVFQDRDNRAIFAGRDVATLNVCRGAWRRSQAMLVRWLQACGANIVGARAYGHGGREPSRLFSLWFYLIYREPGRPRFLGDFVQDRYGLAEESLQELEQFGEELARRKRSVPAASAPPGRPPG